jgi:hypothetical protein
VGAHLPKPGGTWLPAHDLADESRVPTLQHAEKARQVGVRLSAAQYQRLARAAELHGVAPTTLARVLINRGAIAVLNAYWHGEVGIGDRDPDE